MALELLDILTKILSTNLFLLVIFLYVMFGLYIYKKVFEGIDMFSFILMLKSIKILIYSVEALVLFGAGIYGIDLKYVWILAGTILVIELFDIVMDTIEFYIEGKKIS